MKSYFMITPVTQSERYSKHELKSGCRAELLVSRRSNPADG